ncbi:hypothetical protein DFH06DRAFT_1132135 [Mycena polygramma]|nr:hypothetical protein DFH06DRAFT_1132135 [Mycena polygramma]
MAAEQLQAPRDADKFAMMKSAERCRDWMQYTSRRAGNELTQLFPAHRPWLRRGVVQMGLVTWDVVPSQWWVKNSGAETHTCPTRVVAQKERRMKQSHFRCSEVFGVVGVVSIKSQQEGARRHHRPAIDGSGEKRFEGAESGWRDFVEDRPAVESKPEGGAEEVEAAQPARPGSTANVKVTVKERPGRRHI